MDPSIIVDGIAVLAIVCVSLLVRHLRREHGHLDALKAEIEAAKRRDDQGVKRMRARLLAAAGLVLVLVGSTSLPTPNAQATSHNSLEELEDRLESVRSDLADIQGRAGTVRKLIASVNDQIAVVSGALEELDQFIAETQSRIVELEDRIESKQRIFDTVEQQAEDIAVELYKGGPLVEVEVLLTARDMAEVEDRLKYIGTVADEQSRVMVNVERLRTSLEEDQATLELALRDAIMARKQENSQAQQLAELKKARTEKLGDLEERIGNARDEAAAIEAESQEVAQTLEDRVDEQPAPHAAPNGSPLTTSSGFSWPLSGAITSGFGPRWGRTHSGIDIDGVTGDPIAASKGGTVVSASNDPAGYGLYVLIDHGGGFASLYAHTSRLFVSSGQSVSQGETIAAVGNTGSSTGDHLHFEIRVNGTPQDPLLYLP